MEFTATSAKKGHFPTALAIECTKEGQHNKGGHCQQQLGVGECREPTTAFAKVGRASGSRGGREGSQISFRRESHVTLVMQSHTTCYDGRTGEPAHPARVQERDYNSMGAG